MEITPTKLRENVYSLLKSANSNSSVIHIHSSKNPDDDAVLMNSKDYDSFVETMHVLRNKQLQDAMAAGDENNPDDWTEMNNGIDWNNL